MEQKGNTGNKRETAEAIQRSSVTQSLHLKLIPVSRKPAVLAYHLGELTLSANPGKLRR
jgi:hypothetical protein